MSVLSVIFAVWFTVVCCVLAAIAFAIGMTAWGAHQEHEMYSGEDWELLLLAIACLTIIPFFGFANYIIWIWALA